MNPNGRKSTDKRVKGKFDVDDLGDDEFLEKTGMQSDEDSKSLSLQTTVRSELMDEIDQIVRDECYSSRSEFLREVVRSAVIAKRFKKSNTILARLLEHGLVTYDQIVQVSNLNSL